MNLSIYFIRFYKIGAWLGLSLLPTLGLLGLNIIANPTQKFILFTFHEIAISIACIFSALVGWVAYQGYQKNGILTLRYWSFAFLGFAIIYSLHGLLTRTALVNPTIFLLFGPTSRIILSIYLLWGILQVNRSPDEELQRFNPIKWRMHIAFFLGINIGLLILLISPLTLTTVHIRSLEAISLIILNLAFIRMLPLLPIRSPLMQAHFLAIIFFIQASICFLSSTPWNVIWWYAHACSGIGFFILGYGIVRAYETAETFESVYDLEELRKKLVQTEEERTELALLIQEKEKAESELQAALHELQEMQVQLELRVAARTVELKDLKEEAERAKKVADRANHAKSEFLSKMSHELRTPLNAILGFTQLLVRDRSLTPQQQEHLGIISRAGEHLLCLIDDVLEMSKIEAGQVVLNPTTFDLYHLLNSLEEMLKLKAESKGIGLIAEKTCGLPQYIRTDERKLRQVLINLVGNAIKFTQNGFVKVRMSYSQDKADASPTYLFCEVTDTGVGIAAAEIDSLFNPFVQTESGRKSHEGTGLGLPISKQFVQLMGGEINVESTLERGTAFRFQIPISIADRCETTWQASDRRVLGLQEGQGSYRILIVEDKRESRLLLANLLSSVGFEIQEATNGQEAVQIWECWQPHFIWMDIQMPVMDGYEATRYIKKVARKLAQKSEKGERLPTIVALTAIAFEEQRSRILAAGCDDVVSKPFRSETIFEKMAQYLGVQYIYESLTEPFLNSQVSFQELTDRDLADMPHSWISQLYQAAAELEEERILQLVEQVQAFNPILAEAIADLAKKLRFDKIIALTKSLIG